MNRAGSLKTRGFTLLELIVALTVLSVVSTIGITGFFRITEHWNDTVLTMRLNNEATGAFESFAADFQTVLSEQVAGNEIRGLQADMEDNVRFWRMSFEDDRIIMPVERHHPITGDRERLMIDYAIERNGGSGRLVRGVTDFAASGDGVRTVVANDIAGMRIQYFDGRDWRSQWDASSMPKLVRVSLSVMDNARPDRHISRVAVFRIQVK